MTKSKAKPAATAQNASAGASPAARYASEEVLGAARVATGQASFVARLEALLIEESGEPAWAQQFSRYTASVIARRMGKTAAAEMIFRNMPDLR